MKPLTYKLYTEDEYSDSEGQYHDDGLGAAGCIFIAKDTGRILLAHRSSQVNEPHTWGSWGGKIDRGESPKEAVTREVEEETGYNGNYKLAYLWTFEDPAEGFQYHNYLAIVEFEFLPRKSWEHDGGQWVEWGKWPHPLHFGLKALLTHAGDKIQKVIQLIKRKHADVLEEKAEHFNSDEFKRWFGNSVVKSDDGTPLVVYHGTNQPIKSFSHKRKGMSTQSLSSKKGFFFTDSREVAQQYAAKAGRTVRSNISAYEKKTKQLQQKVERLERLARITGNWDAYQTALEAYETYELDTMREDDTVGQNIIPVYLRIENPLVYDFQGKFQPGVIENLMDTAVKNGNDGVIMKNMNDPLPLSTHYIVFKSTQIKSAVNNSGQYHPKKPNITAEAMDTLPPAPPAIIHQIPSINTNLIADAIFVEEGGYKTKYPYGVSIMKSGIQTKSIEDARQICLNTINHAYKDWVSKGHEGDFIDFLSLKYDSENHVSWAKNIKLIMAKLSKTKKVPTAIREMIEKKNPHDTVIFKMGLVGDGLWEYEMKSPFSFIRYKFSPKQKLFYFDMIGTPHVNNQGKGHASAIMDSFFQLIKQYNGTLDCDTYTTSGMEKIKPTIERLVKKYDVRMVKGQVDEALDEALADWNDKYWVHYSDVDYLKINPNPNSSSDPKGIYLFPLKLDLSDTTIGRFWERKKYKFLVEVKHGLNILDLISLSLKDCVKIIIALGHRDKVKLFITRDCMPSIQYTDRNHPWEVKRRKETALGHVFWEFLRVTIFDRNGQQFAAHMKKLGYDGIFGDAEIIFGEEVQLIIFDEENVKVVKIEENDLRKSRAQNDKLKRSRNDMAIAESIDNSPNSGKLSESYGGPGDHVVFGGVWYPDRVVANIVDDSGKVPFGHTRGMGRMRWVYYQDMKTVFWHEKPDQETRDVVVAWLNNKGYEVEKHKLHKEYWDTLASMEKAKKKDEPIAEGEHTDALDREIATLEAEWEKLDAGNYNMARKMEIEKQLFKLQKKRQFWRNVYAAVDNAPNQGYATVTKKRKNALLMESRTTPKQLVEFLRAQIKGTEWDGKVFAVGGFVRDLLLGKEPKDLDVVVGVNQGGLLFTKWLGQKLGIYKEGSNPVIYPTFGTANLRLEGVVWNGLDFSSENIDAVMFRKEQYHDPNSRKPVVQFTPDIAVDAQRRDITFNALYLDIASGEILDPTGRGKEDLKAGVVRTAIDPTIIYTDDALRMFRAVRFAAQFNFQLSPEVIEGIKNNLHRLNNTSKERVRDELNKILVSKHPDYGLRLLRDTGLLSHISPSLQSAVGMTQNKHHSEDVFSHIISVVSKTKPTLISRLGALLHDIGKVATRQVIDNEVHFYSHEDVGADMAKDILTSLKYPNNIVDPVVLAVRNHMRMKQGGREGEKLTDKSLRKLIVDLGEHLDDVMDIIHSDNISHSPESSMPNQIPNILKRIEILKVTTPKKNEKLPLTGDDLKSLGLQPGPLFGKLLNMIKDKQLENPNTTKEEYLILVKTYLEGNKV